MATATATFESFNPSTGEVIESFPRSTAADVDRAVDAALEAWEGWRLTPASGHLRRWTVDGMVLMGDAAHAALVDWEET